MSGDSPNALGNDNVFDFKDGRASPGPTTSKHDQGASGVVNASVLVEPHKDKSKDGKEHEDKEKEEDKPDFCSPIFNNPDESSKDGKEGRRGSEGGKDGDFPHGGGGGRDKKEVQNLLNGDTRKEAYVPRKDYDEESDEDTCIVNCLYYTMECCKCSIM